MADIQFPGDGPENAGPPTPVKSPENRTTHFPVKTVSFAVGGFPESFHVEASPKKFFRRRSPGWIRGDFPDRGGESRAFFAKFPVRPPGFPGFRDFAGNLPGLSRAKAAASKKVGAGGVVGRGLNCRFLLFYRPYTEGPTPPRVRTERMWRIPRLACVYPRPD